ncbi:hypothetical protein WR25_27286 [Diploscapter pachys]|uniref:AMP-binding enzyme C-terminal domain-containing protein n=1 Tax=Diploscapter pachys TaxID=2018661 RepID=A0A2A2JH84_9BILA|nr:hypothetical protein WR25_27286 [Diploscapter pachys]
MCVKDDVVALATLNTWHYLAFFMGAAVNGGAGSGMAPISTPLEMQRQISECGASAVLTTEAALPKVLEAIEKCPKVKTIVVIGDCQKDSNDEIVSWDDVIRTKHLNFDDVKIDAKQDVIHLPFSRSDRLNVSILEPPFDFERENYLLYLPFYHVYGLMIALDALHLGVCSVVMSHFNPTVFCQSIEKYKMRTVNVVPPILLLMVKSPLAAKFDLSSVELIVSGAAPLGKDLCEEVIRKLPKAKIQQGDIGYLDNDCHLFVVDRLKELIKVKGFQVPPAELESLLLTHPKIKDAAVIGINHENLGEVPKAYIVAQANASLTEDEVHLFVNDKVSKYKQLLGGIEFIDEIPKAPSGKILRRLLRKKHNNNTL